MTTELAQRAESGLAINVPIETLQKLVLNGDLSQLTQEQKLHYYLYRCKAMGLDPATKPMDVLKLNGKEVLYATKECSAQLSNLHHLSATVVSDGNIGDIYRVVARAAGPDGRATDDMGCVNIKGLSGEALCNAMMKATTKAKRRAILTHCGLGMLDESELDSIPKDKRQQAAKPILEAQVSREKTADVSTVPVEGSPEPTIIIDDPEVGEHGVESSEPPSEDLKKFFGTVAFIKEKSGTGKQGPWIKYSIKAVAKDGSGDRWFTTFSQTLGKVAKDLKGTDQTLIYSESQWNGMLQYDLEGFER